MRWYPTHFRNKRGNGWGTGVYSKSDGNLETQVFYYGYKDFGTGTYPTKVVIKRPIEDIQIVLTVDKVAENQTLSDGQFVLEPTEGTKIQNLE